MASRPYVLANLFGACEFAAAPGTIGTITMMGFSVVGDVTRADGITVARPPRNISTPLASLQALRCQSALSPDNPGYASFYGVPALFLPHGFYTRTVFGFERLTAHVGAFIGLTDIRFNVGSSEDFMTSGSIVGVGFAPAAALTTLKVISHAGAEHVSPHVDPSFIDLGADFPAAPGIVYQLEIWADAPGAAFNYQITNVNSGKIAAGVVAANIPVPSDGLLRVAGGVINGTAPFFPVGDASIEVHSFYADLPMSIASAPTTSYNNPGGKGNRTSIINVTTDFALGPFAPNTQRNLVNGGFANNNTDATWFNPNGQTAKSLIFDFGHNVVINELTWYQDVAINHGPGWTVDASLDGSTWTVLSSSFTLGTVPTQVVSFANGTPYRYYRLALAAGGTGTSNGAWLREVEFKIG